MVQATQLPLRVEVRGCGRLRFDNGGEFVGGVIHSGSVGEVNESAGREAVTARRRASEDNDKGHMSAHKSVFVWTDGCLFT